MREGRIRPAAWQRLALVAAAVLGLGGCGVGFGAAAHTASFGEMQGLFNDVPAGKLRASGRWVAPVIQVYDKTGILLAAMGNAGAAYNARRDAERDAVRRGARAGDRFSYNYRVTAPTPGLLTSFSLSWADTDTLTMQKVGGTKEQEVKPTTAEYFEFDTQLTLGQPRLARHFVGTVQLGVYWRSYDLVAPNLGTGAIPYETSGSWIGIPISFRVDWTKLGVVRPWARVQIDPLMSLLTKAVGDEGQSWLYYRVQGGVDVPIADWLAVGAWLGHERMPFDFGDNDTFIYQGQIVLSAFFGG